MRSLWLGISYVLSHRRMGPDDSPVVRPRNAFTSRDARAVATRTPESKWKTRGQLSARGWQFKLWGNNRKLL